MVVLSLTVPADEAELVIADLSEHALEGIREEELPGGAVRLDVFLAEAGTAESLAAQFPAFPSCIVPADSRDWVQHAREMWKPIEVGDRFFLVPEWDEGSAAPEGRILLRMPVGQGFGSGFHETTQLALRALEITDVAGVPVLDVGTGSGILLAGAHALGATGLTGCDVDPVAVDAARSYLGGAGLEAALYLGSIDAVRPQRFPVILANLNATLILNLLDDLFAALQPRGKLILSGILDTEAAAIHGALERVPGVTRIYHSALGDWVNFRVTTGV
jgi:ribosomal protein L11 methyltransferase